MSNYHVNIISVFGNQFSISMKSECNVMRNSFQISILRMHSVRSNHRPHDEQSCFNYKGEYVSVIISFCFAYRLKGRANTGIAEFSFGIRHSTSIIN